MDFQSSNNKFFSYVVILVGFFILLFITKDFFYVLQEKLDERNQNERNLEKAKSEHSELEELKVKFESNQDELLKNVSKYTLDFNSENLFNYIHSYVENVNSSWRGSIIIRSLTLSEWTLWDIGMYEGTISVSAKFSSQRTLLDFIDYLVSSESQYTFFIDNFSYPNFGKQWDFQATIPLKMFYKK